MKTNQNLIDHIYKSNINISTLSEKSGISRNQIYKILHGETKNPTTKTINKLCDALRISPFILYDDYKEKKVPVVDCPNNEFDEFTFNLPSCNHIDNSKNINCSKYIVNYVSLGFCDKTYIDNESYLDCLYAYNLKQDHNNAQFLKNDLIIISTNFNLENNKYYIIKVNNIYQIMKLQMVENKLVLMPIDLNVQCNIVEDLNNLPDNIKIIAKIVEIRRVL